MKNCISRLWTNPLGDPPPPCPIPKQGEKHMKTALNMLHIPWMVILGDHNIKKNKFRKLTIFEPPKVKNCISRLCTGPFTRPLLVDTIILRLWHRV